MNSNIPCSIGALVLLLSCSHLAMGQTFADFIKGFAVACESKELNESGNGQLGPKTVPSECPNLYASVTASANVGAPYNQLAITAVASGNGAGATVQAAWTDYVSFVPPAFYTNPDVTLVLSDRFFYKITGYIPTGSAALVLCYAILSAHVEDCLSYATVTSGTQVQQVDKNVYLTKGNSGRFESPITVNAEGFASSNGPSSITTLGDPQNSQQKLTFYCPTEGWSYTFASAPNDILICSVP